jgi:hypothetical protein
MSTNLTQYQNCQTYPDVFQLVDLNWDKNKNYSLCAITIFNSNATNTTRSTNAFRTCCGSAPIVTYGNGCYEYCNITDNSLATSFYTCLAANNASNNAECWGNTVPSAASFRERPLGVLAWVMVVGCAVGVVL